jgi:hypothetical protein
MRYHFLTSCWLRQISDICITSKRWLPPPALTMLNNKQLNWLIASFSFLMFCSWIHPYHLHPLRNFYHDTLCIVALITGITCFAFVKKIELKIPSSIVLPLGLMVIVALQALNGFLVLPADSFYPLVDLLCFALAVIFGATVVSQRGGREKLLYGLALACISAGLLSLLFQHIQLIGIDAMPLVMPIKDHLVPRPYANFGQPNLLALVMCFSIASVWWMYATRSLNKWVGLGIVIALLWGVTLTQSRMAWMILPCFVLANWFQPINCTPVARRTLISLLLLFMAMVVSAPHILDMLGFPIASLADRAAQTSVRIILWKQAWALSLLHPWFGVGWLQFGANQVKIAYLFPPTEPVDYAHNIILNFAAELGWPITLLVIVGVGCWFKVSCINHWNKPPVRFLSLMFIAVSLHSMVEFPLWNAFILIPFGVMVGAVHDVSLGLKSIQAAREWVISFCIASIVSIGVVCFDYHRVVNGFQALYQQQTNDPIGAGGTEKPEWTLFPQFYDFFRIDKIKIYQGMAQSDITFLEKMSLEFGFPPVLERLSLAYALNGRPNESLRVVIIEKHLFEGYYPNTYALWAGYAAISPDQCGVVFNHMPKPEKMKTPDNHSEMEKQ